MISLYKCTKSSLKECLRPAKKQITMSTDTHSGCNDQTSAGAIPDLLRPEMLDGFDRVTFERDGYWVWEGVVTDTGCKQWSANLKKLKHMNSEESSQTCLYCTIGLITCKLD